MTLDWVKVVRALDDEWYNRRQGVEKRLYTTEVQLHMQNTLAHLAFMLRDCLVAGMSDADKEKVSKGR